MDGYGPLQPSWKPVALNRPLRSTLGTEFVRDDNARLAPRFEQRREKSRRCDLIAV